MKKKVAIATQVTDVSRQGQKHLETTGPVMGGKYWSSPSLFEPLLPFVLYCLLLVVLPNWTKYGDKYFFPPFIGCHTWRKVAEKEEKKEEVKEGEKEEVNVEEEEEEEEDREIMFSYVEANRRSAASTFCSDATTCTQLCSA